jgi:acetyl-CoA acetyltransferase family protein
MVNPEMPDAWTVRLGEGVEQPGEKYKVTCESTDEFSARSHRNAAQAWQEKLFADEVVSYPGVELDRDENIRDQVTPESLATLKLAFRADGTITAGNASPLSDGAAALALADEATVDKRGLRPLARVLASGAHGVEPQNFGIGPVEAVRQALRRSGTELEDVAVMELNEAFAAQSLACLSEWKGLDPNVVNPRGGAIALGHPLGASGARLAGALARQLSETPGRRGVASLCIGVGQGLALVMEGV